MSAPGGYQQGDENAPGSDTDYAFDGWVRTVERLASEAIPYIRFTCETLRIFLALLDGPLARANRLARDLAAIGDRTHAPPLEVWGNLGIAGEWLALLGGRASWALSQREPFLARLAGGAEHERLDRPERQRTPLAASRL